MQSTYILRTLQSNAWVMQMSIPTQNFYIPPVLPFSKSTPSYQRKWYLFNQDAAINIFLRVNHDQAYKAYLPVANTRILDKQENLIISHLNKILVAQNQSWSLMVVQVYVKMSLAIPEGRCIQSITRNSVVDTGLIEKYVSTKKIYTVPTTSKNHKLL